MEEQNLIWIFAERNSSSDEAISINEVVAKSGELVTSGQYLFELEGAKAVFEVEADQAGYFYTNVESGNIVDVGAVIGVISAIELDSFPEFPKNSINTDIDNSNDEILNSDIENNASNAAIRLSQKVGFNLQALSHLDFITESDVLAATSMEKSEWRSNEIEKILILGAGPHATLILESVSRNTVQRVVGVLDDNQNLLEPMGIPNLGEISEHRVLELFNKSIATHLAIGVGANMKFREKWTSFSLNHEIPMATIIHPDASISPNAKIGPGAVIMDTARIGPHAVLDSNVFLSAGVNIEHHCFIGANCTFGPGVQLSGGVRIGKNCGFGTQVGIEPSITVGPNSQIASGSIITSDIPEDSIVKLESVLKIRTKSNKTSS